MNRKYNSCFYVVISVGWGGDVICFNISVRRLRKRVLKNGFIISKWLDINVNVLVKYLDKIDENRKHRLILARGQATIQALLLSAFCAIVINHIF